MGQKQSDLQLDNRRYIDSIEIAVEIGMSREKGLCDIYNPLASQCIKIDNKPELYSLKSYHKTENSLCYEFEQNIKLCFMKQKNGEIIFNLQTPTTSKTERMLFSDINGMIPIKDLKSSEFDLINNFIKSI